MHAYFFADNGLDFSRIRSTYLMNDGKDVGNNVCRHQLLTRSAAFAWDTTAVDFLVALSTDMAIAAFRHLHGIAQRAFAILVTVTSLIRHTSWKSALSFQLVSIHGGKNYHPKSLISLMQFEFPGDEHSSWSVRDFFFSTDDLVSHFTVSEHSYC